MQLVNGDKKLARIVVQRMQVQQASPHVYTELCYSSFCIFFELHVELSTWSFILLLSKNDRHTDLTAEGPFHLANGSSAA